MNLLSIVYIALIEAITSPPGCKLLYCAEMPQFIQPLGSNSLSQHTQFPYALTSFSRFGKHWYYVAFQFRTSSLTYVRRGAPYPLGQSLPLLCSASLSVLALVHVLSVALLRPVSSMLLSFAGDALPSVSLLALRSHLLLKFYRRSVHCRNPSSRKF